MKNNNLPIEYKKGILYKIKRFFISLFKKNNDIKDIKKIDINNSNIRVDKEFKNSIYVPEVEKIQKNQNIKKSIINMIEENPKLLETMSISNLEKLTILYDEIIEQNNKKIGMLQNKLS